MSDLFWRMTESVWGFILIVVLGTGVLLGGAFAIGERLFLPGKIAQIEQLRSDMQQVSAAESEDVVGQAVQWNQMIRSKQRYNATWWAGPLIPDAWDAVEPIALPER